MRYFIVLWSAVCSLAYTASVEAEALRIGTYNIWNPRFEERYSGTNTWKQRLPLLLENIVMADCDILVLEEVNRSSFCDLTKDPRFPVEYNACYFGYDDDEGRDGLALVYRKKRVTPVDCRQSAVEARPTHRRDFYMDLKATLEKGGDALIRVGGIHVDAGKDIEVGNTQLKAMVNDVLADAGAKGVDVVVVCGDFNEGEGEEQRPRYSIMQQAGFVSDGSVEPTRPEALKVRHSGHVDWIYFKGISVKRFALHALTPMGDERASDHKLTATDLQFPDL